MLIAIYAGRLIDKSVSSFYFALIDNATSSSRIRKPVGNSSSSIQHFRIDGATIEFLIRLLIIQKNDSCHLFKVIELKYYQFYYP